MSVFGGGCMGRDGALLSLPDGVGQVEGCGVRAGGRIRWVGRGLDGRLEVLRGLGGKVGPVFHALLSRRAGSNLSTPTSISRCMSGCMRATMSPRRMYEKCCRSV